MPIRTEDVLRNVKVTVPPGNVQLQPNRVNVKADLFRRMPSDERHHARTGVNLIPKKPSTAKKLSIRSEKIENSHAFSDSLDSLQSEQKTAHRKRLFPNLDGGASCHKQKRKNPGDSDCSLGVAYTPCDKMFFEFIGEFQSGKINSGELLNKLGEYSSKQSKVHFLVKSLEFIIGNLQSCGLSFKCSKLFEKCLSSTFQFGKNVNFVSVFLTLLNKILSDDQAQSSDLKIKIGRYIESETVKKLEFQHPVLCENARQIREKLQLYRVS
jgi:hypothetical protein